MINSRYYSNFLNMFEQCILASLDTESLDNDKSRRYSAHMKEKYVFGGTALNI